VASFRMLFIRIVLCVCSLYVYCTMYRVIKQGVYYCIGIMYTGWGSWWEFPAAGPLVCLLLVWGNPLVFIAEWAYGVVLV